MQRAGVFIGVQKTGGLPQLHDAVGSARRMHDWALTQGMQDNVTAVLVTDETDPVTPDLLSDIVARLIERAEPEQLLVYFAGHGVYLRSGEHWLLSKAPENPNHAVDVSWSMDAARFGIVPNVVFLSDACRTAPEGIQAQQVQGASIFPNVQTAGRRFVDVFFACSLGRPAAEIKDSQDSAGSYRAVYTEVLLDALNGQLGNAFVRLGDSDPAWYADYRRLRDVLDVEVPRRIRSKNLTVRYGQAPDAWILSDPGPKSWLSRVDQLASVPSGPSPEVEIASPPPAAERGLTDAEGQFQPEALTPPAASSRYPYGVDGGSHRALSPPARRITAGVRRTAAHLRTAFGTDTRSAGPGTLETECGISVRGSAITDYVAPGFDPHPVSPSVLGLHPRVRGGSVLLRLSGGQVTVIPALEGFVTSLTFDDDELLAVEYEPTAGSGRWPAYQVKKREIRLGRSVAAAASAFGRFAPQMADVRLMAQQAQYGESIDPSLAIFAAYACYDHGDIESIEGLLRRFNDDTGVSLFDLELLARHLGNRSVTAEDGIVPCVPLLSQGWSLVHSHGVRLPSSVKDIYRHARNSLWSLYDGEAFDAFREALETGVIR